MRAFARVKTHTGETVELSHGDLIGRLWTAALCIDDPRVSEAHAVVSLRSAELRLLALRGRFAVGNKPATDACLVPGMTIALARGLELTVLSVELPTEVLGIEGPRMPRQVLPGVCSLTVVPDPTLRPRYDRNAAATFWTTGAGWTAKVGDTPPRPILPDDRLVIDGHEFRLVAVPLSSSGANMTLAPSTVVSPLRIIAWFDTVHIHRDHAEVVAISGQPARLLSELAVIDGPARWDVVAGEIWSDEADRVSLRRRFDATLSRLRAKLREGGIRPDLIRAGGTGHFELLLHERDEVDDRT